MMRPVFALVGLVALVAVAFVVLSGSPPGTEASHGAGFLYTVEQGGGPPQLVSPLVKADTVQNFYKYNGFNGGCCFASSDTGLEQSDVSILFLYEDSNTGVVSLSMIHDIPNDGSGGKTIFTFGGVPAGTTFTGGVRDDGAEAALPTSTWRWANCCTDGGALSGSLENQAWTITIDPVFPTSGGLSAGKIDTWQYLTGDINSPTVIPLTLTTVSDPTKRVTIKAWRPLDEVCSDGQICKTAAFQDADGDGIIEVGEPVDFLEVIEVQNASPGAWTNTKVTDRWGAEIDVTSATPSKGTATLTTIGKSDKEFLGIKGGKNAVPGWVIGTLGPGETANLVLESNTDLTPEGFQSYTRCSLHRFNSGAVLKFLDPAGQERVFKTGRIVVSVLTVDLLGDCDGDGFSDAEELAAGTDPHDPLDFPVPTVGCAAAVFDICIDADGTATAGDGIPGAVEVTVGTVLAPFPTVGFNNSGLDMFDNDGNGAWTFGPSGDDLHVEGTTFCPTAIRDGVHQLGLDCKVLDIDGSLFTGQPVNCDLEVGAFCVPPLPSPIMYNDVNGNTAWDDGEDIVLDVNGNGVFD